MGCLLSCFKSSKNERNYLDDPERNFTTQSGVVRHESALPENRSNSFRTVNPVIICSSSYQYGISENLVNTSQNTGTFNTPREFQPSRTVQNRPNTSQNTGMFNVPREFQPPRTVQNRPNTSQNTGMFNVPERMENINDNVSSGCKILSPSIIHYTQDSIASTFFKKGRHGGVNIGTTLDELLLGNTQIKDIPCITVCWYKQKWFSLDNRRLWVLKKYEEIKGTVKITVKVTQYMDEDKYKTFNGGKEIRVRGNPGGYYWKKKLRNY